MLKVLEANGIEADLVVGASVGITVWQDALAGVDELLVQSDTALYAAKESGRGRHQVYAPVLGERSRRRQAIEEGLRQAIGLGQLALHAQPKVEIGSGRLAGVEAPKFEDNEASLAELRERIRKTVEFVRSVPAAAIDGWSEGDTELLLGHLRGSGKSICGLTLTNTEATPENFAVFLKPRCDPLVAAFARSDEPGEAARQRGESQAHEIFALKRRVAFLESESRTANRPVIHRPALEDECARAAIVAAKSGGILKR